MSAIGFPYMACKVCVTSVEVCSVVFHTGTNGHGTCPFWSDSADVLSAHLFRRHKHSRNFMVHCSACGSSFRKIDPFRKHYNREHYRNVPVTVPDSQYDDSFVDN